MKHILFASGLAVATLMSVAVPAAATTLTFATTLNGSNARPNPTDSTALGQAKLEIDISGTSDQTLDFNLEVIGLDLADLGGLPQPVLDTAGPVHLHVGGPEETGPIAVAFGPTSGSVFDDAFPNTLPSISALPGFSINADNVGFADEDAYKDFVEQLVLGNIYVNVHTTAFPSGEIRGNFAAVPSVAAVPLPAPVFLLLGAFCALAGMRWRKAAS